jgi:hypothetical protein
MDPKSDKPLRLFVNPLTVWTELAFKTGQAMLASAAQAAAARAPNTAPKVAVIPTADAPAPKAQEAATPKKAPRRQASKKAARSKAPRSKPRRKAALKRRAARR